LTPASARPYTGRTPLRISKRLLGGFLLPWCGFEWFNAARFLKDAGRRGWTGR
jgi:hypothetical protein